MHVGTFPRPTLLFPAGGPAGETVSVRFFSEATGEFIQQVKLPEAPNERFGVLAERDGLTAPSPDWMRVSSFSNVLKVSPNQDREHATATDLMPPFALNGILSEKGEEDWCRFQGVKGQVTEVTVYARRLRSPVDSVIDVFDATGKSLASNDDAGGPDSSLKFTPSATTNYFMRVRDLLKLGGRDFVYRVEVTPVAPSLVVRIPEVARNDTQTRWPRNSLTITTTSRSLSATFALRAPINSARGRTTPMRMTTGTSQRQRFAVCAPRCCLTASAT